MKFFDKIFKSKQEPSAMDKLPELTTITRKVELDGFSVPAIINNMDYHYIGLNVYADGLVDCWGMVDLAIFKEKLDRNWVVLSIPDGKRISVFGLGSWVISEGNWMYTNQTFYEYIYALVKKLNPLLENLRDYNGVDVKVIDGVRFAKDSSGSPQPYYNDNVNPIFGNKHRGASFSVFYYNTDDDKTYLAKLIIYKNGRVEISDIPDKKYFDFKDLETLIETGQVKTEVKIDEIIYLHGLGSFKVALLGTGVNVKEKYHEFLDKYNELNGEENSIQKCARIFETYKQLPTKILQKELKEAYEAVPEQQKIFVGTMDTKDYEVRQAIYGDIVKKEWEEYYGYPYPHGEMPQPID